MEKALIIEDDRDISELISIHLSDMDLEVDKAFDGKDGLMKALNNHYRFILLDIRLPLLDGFEVCKRIRMEKNNTPILMLTSKAEEIDKVLGLEIGADDYISKPFSIRELIARIKAVLRRYDISLLVHLASNLGKTYSRMHLLNVVWGYEFDGS